MDQTLDHHINKTLYKASIVAWALVVILTALIFWILLTPKGATGNCASFGSYADILVSLHKGNTGLDGDHDGIPCESRLPEYAR